jgi:tetratricopeptide (TPR) repeat protein
MKYLTAKAGALAVAGLFLAAAGWAQQAPALNQPKPGQKGGPTVTKPENDAYKAIYNAQKALASPGPNGAPGDPAHLIELSEAFVAKFPMSYYAGPVYGILTGAYLNTNQTDKMVDAGQKALALDPDNIDVLPIMAWAIPRKTNANTAENRALLEKAQGYAHHGLDLLMTLQKPVGLSDADFEKNKKESSSMCHDGLGVVAVKTGKYDEAVDELKQAIMLADMPDPVDFYLLAVADENTSHFSDATANFTKCAAAGPMQAQCKSGIDDVKKKSQNSLEAPQ